MRRGFTLHEIIISLTVTSGVLAVAAHFSTHQLRFLRTVTERQVRQTQLGEAAAIVAAVLANAYPGAGDILVAEDSVLELRLTTGVGVVCAATPARVVVSAGTQDGAAALYADPPQAGDSMDALFADSSGVTWLRFSIAATVSATESCGDVRSASAAVALTLVEPMTLPVGAPVRFTRPFRLSHYRSSDGDWYLGGRDWNGAEGRFNSVQPLAGPLLGRNAGTEDRGLALQYLDSLGSQLPSPTDPRQIASVRVVVRGAMRAGPSPAAGARDSLVRIIAVRQ